MTTASVTRNAVKLLDRRIATLTQLRSALVKLGKFADSYQPATRKMSKAARRRISIAQRNRWAKLHKKNGKVIAMKRSA